MNNVTALATATVLVVDDDPGTIATFSWALRNAGCRVVTAVSGCEGIERAGETVPDLVLCDLNLPDISGVDVCRALRTRIILSPFVIMTGCASLSAAFEAGHVGATGFLEKPIDVDDLVATAEEQLQEGSGKTAPLGYDAQMGRITHMIERNYADPMLSVRTVARRVGLSTQHVCRVLKVRHQKKFATYLRDLRINEARRLLEDSNLTAKEVAFRVGFRSASQFARTFRDAVGTSPSEYQRGQTRRHGV